VADTGITCNIILFSAKQQFLFFNQAKQQNLQKWLKISFVDTMMNHTHPCQPKLPDTGEKISFGNYSGLWLLI
jgi:hypothetical protein